MQKVIEIKCPEEILMGLHMDSVQFADFASQETAIALFREKKISSGMAAKWLGMSRVHFLLKAMEEGSVSLLDNNEEDYLRETSLL